MYIRAFQNTATKVTSSGVIGRSFHSSKTASHKVAVLGAGGGIGQPLSLLCKLSPQITELSCYDINGTPGIAADLSHIPSKAQVTGQLPSPITWPSTANENLGKVLDKADIVIIPAGVPRKPGMTRDDLFNTNASIVQSLAEACADYCPNAILGVISNPVNSTVPIAAEVYKKKGVFDPKKIVGVTTLDGIRANTFLAANQGVDPKDMNVTVIGGHAGITILPLFSQVPKISLSDGDREALTVRTQFGGDEVVKAKAGAGSATLSMAYAGYLFTENVLKGLSGDTNVVQCAFVESDIVKDVPYFASPCRFGKDGVEEVMGFGSLSDYEQMWFEKMKPDLQKQIQKGIDFASK